MKIYTNETANYYGTGEDEFKVWSNNHKELSTAF